MIIIIEKESKRIKYDVKKGIYNYIFNDWDDIEVPEKYETVHVDEFNLNGMYLPKWTGNEFIESANDEEIYNIEMHLTNGRYEEDSKKPLPTDITDLQITHLQLAIVELYEQLLNLKGAS